MKKVRDMPIRKNPPMVLRDHAPYWSPGFGFSDGGSHGMLPEEIRLRIESDWREAGVWVGERSPWYIRLWRRYVAN